MEGEGEEKGSGCTVHVLSSDLICGMVVTGSASLSPRVFNGANDALELERRRARRDRERRLTNREDVPFPTYHLIRLSCNEEIMPDVCRAACVNSNSREGPEKNVEPVAL